MTATTFGQDLRRVVSDPGLMVALACWALIARPPVEWIVSLDAPPIATVTVAVVAAALALVFAWKGRRALALLAAAWVVPALGWAAGDFGSELLHGPDSNEVGGISSYSVWLLWGGVVGSAAAAAVAARLAQVVLPELVPPAFTTLWLRVAGPMMLSAQLTGITVPTVMFLVWPLIAASLSYVPFAAACGERWLDGSVRSARARFLPVLGLACVMLFVGLVTYLAAEGAAWGVGAAMHAAFAALHVPVWVILARWYRSLRRPEGAPPERSGGTATAAA
jgi:hypothetical protein